MGYPNRGQRRRLRGEPGPRLAHPLSQAGTSSSAEDEGPISMRGMRLSLQASQANLLTRGAEDKAEDDEEWDDD